MKFCTNLLKSIRVKNLYQENPEQFFLSLSTKIRTVCTSEQLPDQTEPANLGPLPSLQCTWKHHKTLINSSVKKCPTQKFPDVAQFLSLPCQVLPLTTIVSRIDLHGLLRRWRQIMMIHNQSLMVINLQFPPPYIYNIHKKILRKINLPWYPCNP